MTILIALKSPIWIIYTVTSFLNNIKCLLLQKSQGYLCLVTTSHNGARYEQPYRRLYRDNTKTSSLLEISLRYGSCIEWHLRFYVVHVSASLLSSGSRIWSDSGWRRVAHRTDSWCRGDSVCRLSVWQERQFLVVSIWQKKNLALDRYNLHLYYILCLCFVVL